MTAIHTVSVQTTLTNEGSILLRATREDGRLIQPTELKALLFAWHEKSYYGTLIPSVEYKLSNWLSLSASMALDYFSAPRVLEHAHVQWDSEALRLIQVAPHIREALLEGQYAPDASVWKSGRMGWKLLNDGSLHEEERVFANAWLSRSLQEYFHEQPAIKEAWEQLLHSFPLLAAKNVEPAEWIEEDWLTAVGWTPDKTPFRTCLKLDEPEFGQAKWPLHVWLQDKADSDMLIAATPTGQPVDTPFPPHWHEWLERVEKDVQKCIALLSWLQSDAPDESLRTALDDDEAWLFLSEGSIRLAEAGVTLFLPSWWERLKKSQLSLKASLASSTGSHRQSLLGLNSIMKFDWKLAVDDLELTEEEFSQLLAQKKRLAYIRGRWVQLDQNLLRQVQQVVARVQKKHGLTLRDVLEMHLLGTLSDGVEREQQPDDFSALLHVHVELNRHLGHMIEQLTTHERIPLMEPPASLHGTLRNYQLEGSSWLAFLRRFGLGGCLADDMGLGKTVQFIAYLLHTKEQQQAEPGPPSLLICPTSVLGNWQKELLRFAPDLRVHLHYGSARKKGDDFLPSIQGADLVMTSYTLAHLDEAELTSLSWSTICLDEAQNIKNVYTKQAQSIRQLNGHHRIAMTGTPIENRLTELWSIFDFANPGYLGGLRTFQQRFVAPIEKSNDTRLISEVQRLVRPFLLRRVKTDPSIQLDLPDKNEAKVYVSLTAEQAALYEGIIQDMFTRIETASAMERRGLIFSVLTKLKQLCNHPALLLKENGGKWRDRSNKIERLLEQIDELRQEGEQCLIFTQFVEMGHLLQTILQEERGEPVLFLHGGVPKAKRDEMIARFQDETLPSDERPGIFLLSLKAGGIGLNLTAANHVFHIDRWWNPAVENQATDRAYRIGQKRNVQVHKFVTLGTLEERIDEMLERKQGISEQIISGGEGWITELSTDELRELFALRREWVE